MLCLDQNLNKQEEQLALLMSRLNLFNMITKPTREQNILDLIMTNDSTSIRKVDQEINVSFSDHNLIKCLSDVSILSDEKGENISNIVYATKIPEFELNKATEEQWDNYFLTLNEVDWEQCVQN